MTENRPWGFFTILHEDYRCKVKQIVVLSKHKISLQSHSKRNESWTIVSGNAIVEIDSVCRNLGPGAIVNIPRGSIHRIWNLDEETLVFIEVQTGDYFGEDDIIRYQDDYGRV